MRNIINRILKRVFYCYTFLIIVFSPIPMGSNRDWGVLGLSILLLVHALISVLLILVRKKTTNIRSENNIPIFLILILLSIGLVFHYVSPLSIDSSVNSIQNLLNQTSREKHSLLTSLIDYFALDSIDGLYLFSFLSFSLLFVISLNRNYITWLSSAIFCSFILQTIIGSIEYVYGIDILVYDREPSIRINGTFVNANHYATYIAGITAMIFGILVSRFQYDFNNHFLKSFIVVLSDNIFLVMLTIIGILLLGASGSRGALLALSMTIVLFSIIVFAQSSSNNKLWKIYVFWVVIIFSGIYTVLIDSNSLQKLWRAGIYDLNRIEEWIVSIRAISESPFIGYGLGSFQDTFNLYRNGSLQTNNTFDHSHSSIFKVLIEFGFVGLTICILCLLYWYSRILSFLFQMRSLDKRSREIIYASICSVSMLLIHSFIDFTLSIPAVFLLFVVQIIMATYITRPKALKEFKSVRNN